MKPNIYKLLITVYCLLFSGVVMAQDRTVLCGFDNLHKQALAANPQFAKSLERFDEQWVKYERQHLHTRNRMVMENGDTVYEIPVVVHVIHTGGAVGTNYNPSDQRIIDWIDYLNQVYAATYPSYPGVGAGGVKIPLRFVLAKRDPSCNATTGIDRVNGVTALGGALGTAYQNNGVNSGSSGSGITDEQLKAISVWPSGEYYNIWITCKIDGWDGYGAGSGVAGYAYFPGGDPTVDGAVIMSGFAIEDATVLPHEMGHAFNLYHTFQGGCGNPSTDDCAATGDLICDTDPHDVPATSSCPTGNNPCTGLSWVPVENNIMNYTGCTDRFTPDQEERMIQSLYAYRGSLLSSLGATAIGDEPTSSSPVASSCTWTHTGSGYDVGPHNVFFADMSSFSNGYDNDGDATYIDHTSSSDCHLAAVSPAMVQSDSTYEISISSGLNPEKVRVWIDYNNNGTFEASELVFSHDGTANNEVHTGNIQIPATGVVTNTPLRMRVASDAGGAIPPSCGNLAYGQAEDFSIIVNNTPLAISLIAFTANANQPNRSIDLAWQAADAKELKSFDIEKSEDGKLFRPLSTVNSNPANNKYEYSDRQVTTGKSYYYRLKMPGNDGKIVYSKVAKASLSAIKDIVLYPNPAGNYINIDGNAFLKSGYIINTLGQVVARFTFDHELPHHIDLSPYGLVSGMYYCVLNGNDGSTTRIAFMKQ